MPTDPIVVKRPQPVKAPKLQHEVSSSAVNEAPAPAPAPHPRYTTPAESHAALASLAGERRPAAAGGDRKAATAPAQNGSTQKTAPSTKGAAAAAPSPPSKPVDKGASEKVPPPSMGSREPSFHLARRVSSIRQANVQRPLGKVRIAEGKPELVEVPVDQLDPMDVWNVYSPVRYVTRKEQRALEIQRQIRTSEILAYCSCLFKDTHVDPIVIDFGLEREKVSGKNGAAPNNPPSNSTRPNRALLTKEEERATAAAFVMSMWPRFPVQGRPSISPDVETAFPFMYSGTQLCIFNEEMGGPSRCTAAFRVLRSADGDESSIAIYNTSDLSAIDGFIPLYLLHSVTRGLESVERHRYVRDGTVKCRVEDGKTVYVNYSRAFTLHCRTSQRFYVSFMAFKDKDLDMWMKTLSYFVYLNSQYHSLYPSA